MWLCCVCVAWLVGRYVELSCSSKIPHHLVAFIFFFFDNILWPSLLSSFFPLVTWIFHGINFAKCIPWYNIRVFWKMGCGYFLLMSVFSLDLQKKKKGKIIVSVIVKYLCISCYHKCKVRNIELLIVNFTKH